MARRVTGGFEISEQAQKAVDEFCARKSMVKKDAVQRVMAWFAAQPQPVQSVVAGTVDEGMELAYAEALERIARAIRTSIESPPGSTRGRIGHK